MTLWSKVKPTRDVLRCSFCNKSQRDVRKLIAGPSVHICDECVDICLGIITEDVAEGRESALRRHSPPGERNCLICQNLLVGTARVDLGAFGATCLRCAEEVRDALLVWFQQHDGAAG
jgi:hypothetical protein